MLRLSPETKKTATMINRMLEHTMICRKLPPASHRHFRLIGRIFHYDFGFVSLEHLMLNNTFIDYRLTFPQAILRFALLIDFWLESALTHSFTWQAAASQYHQQTHKLCPEVLI